MNDEATTHYSGIIDNMAFGFKTLYDIFGENDRRPMHFNSNWKHQWMVLDNLVQIDSRVDANCAYLDLKFGCKND